MALTKVPPSMLSSPGGGGARNLVINGDFDIWMRGDSFTSVVDAEYTANQWSRRGGDQATNITRQKFANGQTDVPDNPKYYMQVELTAGGSPIVDTWMVQPLEDVRRLSGKEVTLRFWAKASSSVSMAGTPVLRQQFGTGGSPAPSTNVDTSFSGTAPALTTSWQEFTFTVTLPSISGKFIGDAVDSSTWLAFVMPSATVNVQISHVQLEFGPSATDFEYRPFGDVFADCQRYFQKFIGLVIGHGYGVGSTSARMEMPSSVRMRGTPTAAPGNGSFSQTLIRYPSNDMTATGVSVLDYDEAASNSPVLLFTVASGGVTLRPYTLSSSINGVELSSEL